jgi:septin family protein
MWDQLTEVMEREEYQARIHDLCRTPLSKFEQERLAHEQKMAKMESEMKAVFQQKVAEKETKLKQSEEEVLFFHVVIRPSPRNERAVGKTTR